MSLNNIELKPQMLVNLYANSLLETSTTTVPEMPPKFWGNNKKNILVIVSHQSVAFLPENELNFLTSILSACKLNLEDIGIINAANTDKPELQIIINDEVKNILLFGVEPLTIGLPINFPQFQLQPFNKHIYLHSPTLSELEKDKTLKLKLWNALKLLFEI